MTPTTSIVGSNHTRFVLVVSCIFTLLHPRAWQQCSYFRKPEETAGHPKVLAVRLRLRQVHGSHRAGNLHVRDEVLPVSDRVPDRGITLVRTLHLKQVCFDWGFCLQSDALALESDWKCDKCGTVVKHDTVDEVLSAIEAGVWTIQII